jgi:hypothetical protein
LLRLNAALFPATGSFRLAQRNGVIGVTGAADPIDVMFVSATVPSGLSRTFASTSPSPQPTDPRQTQVFPSKTAGDLLS